MDSIAYELWKRIKKQIEENPGQEEYELAVNSKWDVMAANQLHNAGFIRICFITESGLVYTTPVAK